MFYGFQKHHGDTRLVTMQYQSPIDKLRRQCKVKNVFEMSLK